MSFQQSYYTSCEVGLRGGKGFQFNATTEGMDPALLAQVERLGLYVPPLSLPSRPTPEEIEGFPIALLYQRLGDGRVALAQARYTGVDYSGRFGNYFTHALVSDDPQADIIAQGFLPIDLWRSENWVQAEAAATTLSPLDHVQTGGEINPESVYEFLMRANRLSYLPQFLTAVERALNGERRIIIVDEDENVALWIAAVSYALPPRLALQLTFNTYVKNPYQTEFLIVGTTADSDFRFAAHEFDYQFFIFDFLGERFSPLPEQTGFAINAASLYAQGAANWLADFGRFIEHSARALALAELDAALACYMLAMGFTPLYLDRAGTIKWLAQNLNAFKPDEIKAVLSGVLTRPGLSEDVIEVSTDLYIAARDHRVRGMIEQPYLQALIGEIAVDEILLHRVLARLPQLDREGQGAAQPLRGSWLKLLSEATNSTHVQALFRLGGKCGYLDDDETFVSIGMKVIAPLPMLLDGIVQQALLEISTTPAFRHIINGVGACLAKKAGSTAFFRNLSDVLSIPAICETLEQYALDERNPRLYVRLLAAVPANHPQHAIQAFQRYIEKLRGWCGDSLPPQEVDDAFAIIWQDSFPEENECVTLLEILLAEAVNDSTIPRQIANFLTSIPLKDLTPEQKKVVQALSKKPFVDEFVGQSKPLMEAYIYVVELEESLAQRDVDGDSALFILNFLEQHKRSLQPAARTWLYEIVAMCLVLVPDHEAQYQGLSQGCRDYRLNFVVSYGNAIINVLPHPTEMNCKAVARFFENWVAPNMEQAIPRQKKASAQTLPGVQSHAKILGLALQRWQEKDLAAVRRQLSGDPRSCYLWDNWRKGGSTSLLSRFRSWLDR